MNITPLQHIRTEMFRRTQQPNGAVQYDLRELHTVTDGRVTAHNAPSLTAAHRLYNLRVYALTAQELGLTR